MTKKSRVYRTQDGASAAAVRVRDVPDDVHREVAVPLAKDLRAAKFSPAEVAAAIRDAVANPESYRSAIADREKELAEFERWAREKEAEFLARIEASS